ncbi:MAG: YceI family protein [Burkholderiales bacterium]
MSKFAIGLTLAALPLAVMAAPETYSLDPQHTFPHFEVAHLGGMSHLRGRFDRTAGKFTIDRAAKIASIELTVQTESVSSGFSNPAGTIYKISRDDLLRSPDNFNVVEFPTMTYKSTSVKFDGDNPATIEGNLTLVGVTRPLTLHVENWKCGPNPFSKKEMCGGNAAGTIKRSDFGMKFAPPAISDEVKLWIEVEAYKN